ncbi:MAG: hypothetical protein LBK73_13700 [Treponema sp.]|nr:hypothetical protein [Treponema sp.]
MAEQKAVVPSSDEGFDRRFALVTQVASQKTAGGASAEWTHIPAEKVTELSASYTAWHGAFGKMSGPHTSVDTAEKNAARDAAEPVLRKFIQRYLYDADDVVTNADLQSVELPVRDHIYTRHGRPEEHVELETRPHEAAEIRIDYRCMETSHRRRTRGWRCIGRFWRMGEAVPEPEALQLSRLITRNPHIVHFDNGLRGRRVAFSAAWENGSSEEGSRCPCVASIIP